MNALQGDPVLLVTARILLLVVYCQRKLKALSDRQATVHNSRKELGRRTIRTGPVFCKSPNEVPHRLLFNHAEHFVDGEDYVSRGFPASFGIRLGMFQFVIKSFCHIRQVFSPYIFVHFYFEELDQLSCAQLFI